MRRWLALLLVVVSAAVSTAAFTDAFDPLRDELNLRKTALTGATDRTGKRRLAAVTKALAALDKLDANVSPSLALDLKTAIATFPALEKAFPTEFPKNAPGVGDLAAALTTGADRLRQPVEDGFVELTTSIGRIPAGRLKNAAQKQATAAGNALGASDVATRSSAAVKLVQKARTAVTKGLALAAKAPVVNVVSATFGTSAYVGQNNYLDYFPGSGGLSLISNAPTQALGGFASFNVSPFLVSVTGPGDYPITGTLYAGPDPGTATSYYISSGTLHLTTFDSATQRAAGTFSFTVTGHPEVSTTDGAFDFYSIRVQ